MNRRRNLVIAGASLLAGRALPGWAQARRSHRIGFLSGGSKPDSAQVFAAFQAGLRELGYREGDNLILDARYAEYSAERARKLAEELAALKPALILANGGGIAPAIRLSPALPVVFLISGDPVDAGFADSFARPGRNATGLSLLALDLIPKRMEFLKQVLPRFQKVAFLASPEHAGQQKELAASRAAAARFGIAVSYHEARTPAELAAALPKVAAERPDGALLFSDALMIGQRAALAEFFLQKRIPSAAGWIAFPQSGHFLSYGPVREAAWRRLASFVDRIIKGARPGDLPIELPTVFELAVNRRTAAAMNIVLPPALMARADHVIE